MLEWLLPLAYPPHAGIALAAASAGAWAFRCRRVSRFLFAGALAWTLLWSVPLAPVALAVLLSAGVATDESDVPSAQAIVVLGGDGNPPPAGHEADPWADAWRHDRVAAGARLWRRGKAPWVVLSGGRTAPQRKRSEAEDMARSIARLGVPRRALLLEERSRSTAENAHFTAALACGRGIGRILLVTTATHMPRARAWFEREGLRVIPVAVPARRRWPPTWSGRWLPSLRAWRASERMLKELGGTVVANVPLVHTRSHGCDPRRPPPA